MKKLILIIVVILTSLNVNSQTLEITTYHLGIPTITETTYLVPYFGTDWDPAHPELSISIESHPITILKHDSLHIRFKDSQGDTKPIIYNRFYLKGVQINIPTPSNIVSFIDTLTTTNYIYNLFKMGGDVYVFKIIVSDPSVNTSGLAETGFDESKLSVFPNPSRDIINIKFHANDTDQPVHIFNLAGQLVYENHDTRQPEQTHLEVNISHFNSGVYFLETNGERQKLIIQ